VEASSARGPRSRQPAGSGFAASFFDYENPVAIAPERALTFLPDRDAADWELLLGYTELRRFSGGELVIRRGDRERALYLLTAGTLHMRTGASGGVLKTIDAPSVVGEVAFLDGGARSADLTAATDGEVRRLSIDGFEALSARHPELGRAILFDLGRITATRLRWLTDRAAGGA
jgi:CRP/FNR family transcriptional regulator, cyclic AMP receptor protein